MLKVWEPDNPGVKVDKMIFAANKAAVIYVALFPVFS